MSFDWGKFLVERYSPKDCNKKWCKIHCHCNGNNLLYMKKKRFHCGKCNHLAYRYKMGEKCSK